MATYNEVCKAANYAWVEFEVELKRLLGDDFDAEEFWNIAGGGICKVNDYVMQATDFGVNCPSCGERLDNEDELQGIGCINCDTEDKLSHFKEKKC